MLKRWICRWHYVQTGNSFFHTSKEINVYFKHWKCEIGLNVYIIDVWHKIQYSRQSGPKSVCTTIPFMYHSNCNLYSVTEPN